MYKIVFGFWSVSLIFISCKNKNGVEYQLQQATAIQKDALKIGESVDSIIDSRLSQGIFEQDIEQLRKHKMAVINWKINMTQISVARHTHEDHNHLHHDHESNDSHLNPADILRVQNEWRDAIIAIRESLK